MACHFTTARDCPCFLSLFYVAFCACFLSSLFLEVLSMSHGSKHILFILYHLLSNVGLTPEFESWDVYGTCKLLNGMLGESENINSLFYEVCLLEAYCVAPFSSVLMDRGAVDTVPAIPTCAIKFENSSSPASMASGGQFPFTPSEMSGLSMETSVLDSAYKPSEDLQLGPDGQTGQLKELFQSPVQNPWNFGLPFLTADWSNLQGEMWISFITLCNSWPQRCKLSCY